jgi:putrescine aminotransferase
MGDLARTALQLARRHGPPGLALGQKLTGTGAIEVSGAGAEVELSDGRAVLDFGSYAVTLLGHRHPAVVAAVAAQLELLPTSTRVLANEVAPRLAARLVEATGAQGLERVWFGLNGSDAVEAALKLARLVSGRTTVVALNGAFHGKSLGALAATESHRYRTGLEGLLSNVVHVELDLAKVDAALRDGCAAAVIFEPVQGEGGVRVIDPAFLAEVVQLARRHGALCISDEIQAGLRRCGPIALAVELGLDVDAILFGKPLGGGVLPLSALVCSDRLYEPLLRDPFVHTSTFSGHPLCCAAGLAALEVIEAMGARVAELEATMFSRLAALAADFPDVLAAVHGRGLLWGLECTSRAAAGWVLAELGPHGLLVSPCMSRPDVIRLLPPAVTTEAQLERADAVLHEVCALARTELSS